LGVIVAFIKNKKGNIKAVGKTLNLLTLLVSISKCLAEKIVKEKEVGLVEAENIVIDCISDGIKTIKK